MAVCSTRIVSASPKDVYMKYLTIIAAASLCILSLSTAAAADTLLLRNGGRVSGRLVSVASRAVTFEDASGVSRRYTTSEIDTIEFSPDVRAGNRERRRDAASNAVRTEVLPSGTELRIRTAEDIDSQTSVVGQTFSGIVERDIYGESGGVVIPQGSHAILVLREVSTGGISGSPDMMVDIQSLTVSGRRYLVSTTDLKADAGTGIGTNKRTAVLVGGGAGVGTIIGAIAGGAKGATIGALIGAAGGAGVQVLNRGKDVRVPAETLLSFNLSAPVTLQAER
jgi:hypothetical protein